MIAFVAVSWSCQEKYSISRHLGWKSDKSQFWAKYKKSQFGAKYKNEKFFVTVTC